MYMHVQLTDAGARDPRVSIAELKEWRIGGSPSGGDEKREE
jgi:hypothetical protein